MMPTAVAVAAAIARCRAARLRNGPDSAEDVEATSVSWLAELGAMRDDTLAVAIGVHMHTPGTGAWWPTPADIFAAAGAVPQLAAAGPEADAVEAWERLLRRLSGALPPPDGKDRRFCGDLLSTEQMRVFQGLGGMWDLARTEQGPALGSFRKRFIDGSVYASRPRARLVSGYGGTRLLNAPAATSAEASDRIRRMLGTSDDPHAARRERANAQGRGE